MARLVITRLHLRKSGNLTVSGLDELYDNLESRLNRTTAKALKERFFKRGEKLRDAIKAAAPFDEKRKKGFHLRDAIFVAPGREDKADVLVGVSMSRKKTGFPAAPHGGLVERGTSRWRGKPYFAKTIISQRSSLAAGVLEDIRDATLGGLK